MRWPAGFFLPTGHRAFPGWLRLYRRTLTAALLPLRSVTAALYYLFASTVIRATPRMWLLMPNIVYVAGVEDGSSRLGTFSA